MPNVAQLAANGVEQRIAAVLAKELHRHVFGLVQIFVAVARAYTCAASLSDVIARIAAFGKLNWLAQCLPIARVKRQARDFPSGCRRR